MRAGDSNTPQNITTHPAASKAASPLTISARSTLRPRSVPTFAVKHRIGRGFAFSVPAKNAAGEGIASPAPATFRRILRISSAAPAMMQIKLPKNLEINTRTRAAHNQGIADLIAGREIKPPRYGKLAAARPTAAAVPKVMEDAGPPNPPLAIVNAPAKPWHLDVVTHSSAAAHPDGWPLIAIESQAGACAQDTGRVFRFGDWP